MYLPDGEFKYGHSTLANEPDYNTFKFNDKYEEMRGSKMDNKTSLEDKNITNYDLGSQDYHVDSDNRQSGDGVIRYLPDADDFMALEDLRHGTEFTITPTKSEESEERKNFYIKGIIDSEVQELIVFFQDSNYQIVKDICLDRELTFHEECSVENCELDHNIISCMLNSDVDGNSELNSETLDSLSCISNGSKFIFEHDCNKDVTKQTGSENLVMEGDVENLVMEGDVENLVMEGDVEIDARDENFVDHSGKNIVPETLLLSREIPSKEAVLANSMVLLVSDAIESNSHSNEAASESEVEGGSTGITHHFDSSISTISTREEVLLGSDCQTSQESESMPRLQDEMSECLTTSSTESSVYQHDQGESSTSMVCPLSGLIAYSGPISCSGSVSLRSNSSTASSRSFAFPILPSEWNGSPMRMAKANRRGSQKHRLWGRRFLCCKF